MAINDTVRLAVKGQVGGQDHVHTLHFRHLSVDATEQSLIDAWQTSCRGAYRDMFRDDDSPVQLYSVAHVCGTIPLRASTEESEVAGSIVGTDGVAANALGDKMAPWLALVLSLRTASAGKSRRGRSYIGGLSEARVQGDLILSGQIGRADTYKNSLLTTFGPAGTNLAHKLVIHSRKLSGPLVQCQNSSTPVVGIVTRSDLKRMTSRKAGNGN
jgi:hypothetical protein